jgi:hypothetical protein
VAATCLYDNMKVVVSRYESDLPVYNTRFLAFATHYGYRPLACRPRRPETKGKVERPFHYVEINLLNGRQFRSLEHLNQVTRQWLAEVADVRTHRQTQRRPIDLWAEERPHLIPLPVHPYDVAEVVYRSVDCEGFIAYRQNQYSVPWRYVGRVLPVRITDGELIVYGPQIEQVARHPLLPRTAARQRRLDPAHRPAEDRRQQHELLVQSFAEFGAVGERFLQGLLKAHRQGRAGAQDPGAAGALPSSRSGGRPGAGAVLRGFLLPGGRTHSARAGPAQDGAGDVGRSRERPAERVAQGGLHLAARNRRLSTALVR